MSIEAINWVLNEAPGLPAHAFGVLLGLANHASPDGTGAWAAQATLAAYARKSDRAVRNDIKELLELGLMVVSDNQAPVAHLPVDKRPVVYDLRLNRKMSAAAGSELPGGSTVPAGSQVPAANQDNSGQDAPTAGSPLPGGSRVPGGSTVRSGRKPTSDKPSTEPKKKTSSSSPPPRKRGGRAKDAAAESDPETKARAELARQVVQWWWDQLATKPAGGTRAFFASVASVEKLLAVGWTANQIAKAARAVGSPITIPRMEIELNRANRTGTSSNGAPPRRATTDERLDQADAALAELLEDRANGVPVFGYAAHNPNAITAGSTHREITS